jgi:hypothetical protein
MGDTHLPVDPEQIQEEEVIMHKIAIIVPTSQSADISGFLDALTKQIADKNPQLNYEVVVVRQAERKALNSGWLCNVGVQVTDAAYFAFHSPELIPGKDADYSLEDAFVQMGDVQIMPMEIYSQVNGYSNEYSGTDVHIGDMFNRCIRNGIFMTRREATFPALTQDFMEHFNASKRVSSAYDRSKDGMSNLFYKVVSTKQLDACEGKEVVVTSADSATTTQAPVVIETLDTEEFHTFWRTRGDENGAESGV